MSDRRDNIITSVFGQQGVGKTWQTVTEVTRLAFGSGKNVMIFDRNGDITASRDFNAWAAHYMRSFERVLYNPRIAQTARRVKYIREAAAESGGHLWVIIPRYRDGTWYSVREVKQCALDILTYFSPLNEAGHKNGVIYFEDPAGYFKNIHQNEEAISAFVSVRHRGNDLIMHAQEPSNLPREFYRQGKAWRIHNYSMGVDPDRAEGKYPILKIAEMIVREKVGAVQRDDDPNRRYFLYVTTDDDKKFIHGISEEEYRRMAARFLSLKRSRPYWEAERSEHRTEKEAAEAWIHNHLYIEHEKVTPATRSRGYLRL